jgi:protein farnesyltransferase subunit beta
MRLLGMPLSDELVDDIADFLSRCQAPSGGFGGGPGQLPHLAPTFAAILALSSLGRESAYRVIDRPALQRFLFHMRQDDGSFIMHEDGEVDVRGAYCALVSAVLTNTFSPELFSLTGQWIASCQTYEGGFSAVPGTEAHGGYTYCGFAALRLLGQCGLCDVRRLLRWACRKQMQVEGGFQGRTNKLVDGCYSFWQGGLFPLIYDTLVEEGKQDLLTDCWHFNQEALQEYVLYCCQHNQGGLVDKPGKSPDFYHTCYCLSGLSVARHCYGNHKTIDITSDPNSILLPTHSTFNIVTEQAQLAEAYFTKQPSPVLLHMAS